MRNARFVDFGGRRLLHVSFVPEVETGPPVILVHSLFEELNRGRAIGARLGRWLVGQGRALHVLDVAGTGDSFGQLETASPLAWQADLAALARELDSGKGVDWLVFRAGALWLPQAAVSGAFPLRNLHLLNPVFNGKSFLTQFLRLRVAASRFEGREETVASLRALALEQGAVEVAGYRLGAGLIAELDALELGVPQGSGMYSLIEVAAGPGAPGVPFARLLEKASEAGWQTAYTRVQDLKFWMSQELCPAAALVQTLGTSVVGQVSRVHADSGFAQASRSHAGAGEGADVGVGAARVPETSANGIADDAAPTPTPTPTQGAPADQTAAAQPPDASDASARRVLSFTCDGSELLGILHTKAPAAGRAEGVPRTGVVVVVGGPQYRCGSHLQFVELADRLAREGVPALRFDARGMGDSEGDVRLFSALTDDISAAVDALKKSCPSLERVVLWALCDGASAALIALDNGLDVDGLILVNPWAQQGPIGEDRFTYYRARLTSAGFWRGLGRRARSRLTGASNASSQQNGSSGAETEAPTPEAPMPQPDFDFVSSMRTGLVQHRGRTLLIESGRDLTADAFRACVRRDRRWRRALARPTTTRIFIAKADHTFSVSEDRERMERACLDWLLQAD